MCASGNLSGTHMYSACAPVLSARYWRAPNSVADLELGHRRAGRLDLTRELVAEDLPPRSQEPRLEPADERLAGAKVGVGAGHPRRADPDEDLVGRRDRLGDVLDPQHVRGSIPIVDDGLHGPS
jgi:hypothetical protein